MGSQHPFRAMCCIHQCICHLSYCDYYAKESCVSELEVYIKPGPKIAYVYGTVYQHRLFYTLQKLREQSQLLKIQFSLADDKSLRVACIFATSLSLSYHPSSLGY